MHDNIKISISGVHSSGKTTLLDRLSRDQFLAKNNFRFGASSMRDLQKTGINISEAGNDITQALIISKHIENAYKEGNYVLDRSIMDSLAYATASRKRNNISAETLIFNEIIFQKLIKCYSLMFYIIPELPLVDDGVRSLDKDYFEDVVDGFEYIVNEYGHDLPLILLSGSIEERYDTAINHIKKIIS